MRKWLYIVFFIFGAALLGAITFKFYSYVFARSVQGEVYGIERVNSIDTLIAQTNAAIPANQLYSFAVAIRDEKTGEIYTGSSEDRQWAVVQKGNCAEAKYYPYPPWNITKSGTYFGVRLLRLYDCKK